MAFEPELLELMPHVVSIQSYLGEDFRGDPQYDATIRRYRSRIVGKGIALRTKMEEQETVVYDVYIGPRILDDGTLDFTAVSDPFKIQDKLTLPADLAWADTTPEIFAVARQTDDEGHHHTKIQCGWMYHRQGQ